MRFTQAYANSTVCSATRTALITGRCQHCLRLGSEEPLVGNPDVGPPPEQPTLPSLLRGGALDYFTHRGPADVGDELRDDEVQIHQMGYLTQLLSERAVATINGFAKNATTVSAEPALQCITLAEGSTGRPGGSAARGRPRAVRFMSIWSRPGMGGMLKCYRKWPRAIPTAFPAPSSRITSVRRPSQASPIWVG